MMTTQRRERIIGVRVTVDEFARISEAARLHGLCPSTFLRMLAATRQTTKTTNA